MWRDQNVFLTSIERNRHTPKSGMSNRYCREMKSARWFSVGHKIKIRLTTDNRS